MRKPHVAVAVLAVVTSALATFTLTRAAPGDGDHPAATPAAKPPAGHDAGPTHHVAFKPDAIKWVDGPPSLPPGAQFAVLDGDPQKPGFFAMRVKMPDGYKIAPHWHTGTERVTVLSGTLLMGAGESFDLTKAEPLPAGTFAIMPAGVRHFAGTKGETVLQLTTVGPWDINYLNPTDDPRAAKK